MSAKEKLKQELLNARISANLRQQDVARLLDCSTQFISNWERGRAIPPISAVRTVAQIYHISDDFLFELILEATIELLSENLLKQFNES